MLTQTAITEALLMACAALITYAYFVYPVLIFLSQPLSRSKTPPIPR